MPVVVLLVGGACARLSFLGALLLLLALRKRPPRVETSVHVLRLLLRGLQDLERAHQRLVDGHHSTSVVEFAAVVGCRKQSDQLPLGKELVAILDNLVGSADEVHVVTVQEFGDYVGTESETDSTVVFTPTYNILVGVRPKQVANQTGI